MKSGILVILLSNKYTQKTFKNFLVVTPPQCDKKILYFETTPENSVYQIFA